MQGKIFYKTKQSLIVFHDHDVTGWGYGLGSAGMGESEFLPFSSTLGIVREIKQYMQIQVMQQTGYKVLQKVLRQLVEKMVPQ